MNITENKYIDMTDSLARRTFEIYDYTIPEKDVNKKNLLNYDKLYSILEKEVDVEINLPNNKKGVKIKNLNEITSTLINEGLTNMDFYLSLDESKNPVQVYMVPIIYSA